MNAGGADYDAIVDGLHERFAATGLIVGFGKEEPAAIQAAPYLWSELDKVAWNDEDGLLVPTYRTRHSLAIPWTERAVAEALVRRLIVALPQAVHTNRSLGGRLRNGQAALVEADAGWKTFGTTEYRVIEFYSEVWEF